MKYLIILLFLFTAQSFANPLKVKGLLCNYDTTHSTPYAFYFNSDYGTYFYRNISKINDEFSINEVKKDIYSTDKDFIYTTYYKVNRKTLALIHIYKGSDSKVGTCEVFNDHKSLEIKFKELKDKYQEEYNKTLEGNKI